MEIVVNKCYGGFGISQLALRKLIEMKSDALNIMSLEEWFGLNKIPDFKNEEYSTGKKKYLTDGKYYWDKYMDYILFTDKEAFSLYDKYEKDGIRTHPDLIKVVRELGDKANGPHAELCIITIPDDVDYEIDDYDGVETIHEKHRSW